MQRVHTLVVQALEDMELFGTCEFTLETWEHTKEYDFCLKLVRDYQSATFGIMNNTLKCVSPLENNKFDDAFIRKFQSYLVDLLYDRKSTLKNY
jgi:hypothetical protein